MQRIIQILLFLLPAVCVAQPFKFTAYTTNEGLSNNTVTVMAKAREGFLWIGTRNGLNRFDGNAFDVFINNPGDSSSIAGNDIQQIYTDRANRLWVTTTSGLSLFSHTTQKFSNYAPDTQAMPKVGNFFPALQEDTHGNIWVGSDYDLLVFDPVTKKFSSSGWAAFAGTVRPANGNHTRVVVLSLAEKGTDELWVLTTYGLYSVNTSTRKFSHYPCPFPGITDFFGSAISYADSNKDLWIGTFNHGLLRFNATGNTWKNYLFPPDIRKKAMFDIAYGIKPYYGDTLIFCANNCLVLFDKRRETFVQTIDTATNNNFPVANYYNILKDENRFWLISGKGFVQMTTEKPLFTYHQVDAPGGVYRLGISSRRNALLIGEFYKKLFYYNPVAGAAIPITAAGQILAEGVRAYTETADTTAYLSTGDKLYRVNPLTAKATSLPLPEKVFADNGYGIRNAVQDRDGDIWIRMNQQGIVHYQPGTGRMVFAGFISPAQNKEYNALYCDKASNTLFVSVKNEGLYIYDIDKHTVQHFQLNIIPSHKGATFSNITGDHNGNIYLADINNGFFVYATHRKTFTRYTVYDGLATNNCYWLSVDSAGYVWMATESGISRFDPVTQKITNYGTAEGHPGYADFIAADPVGNVYQPWQKGYYTWNSNDFLKPEPTGKIYIRHSRLDNRDIPVDTQYNFTATQNNISFQFGYLQLLHKGTVNFEYRLNNGGWMETGSQGLVAFSNLSPNNYRLSVRVKKYPEQECTIYFVIHWPFYKTGWFLLLMGLLILLTAFIIFRNRVAVVKRQSAMKQKIAETEMMALRAQMNPHFIFNCISSIDNFILANDKENASAWLNTFAKLIRSILDNSRQTEIPFWKDWESLRLYTELEQLRANHAFSCTMEADPALLNGHYRIPPLIIQPYVENAIHHGLKHRPGGDGRLRITASLVQQQLVFVIEDNGVGRKKAAALKDINTISHNSYGMQLSSERIQLFNAAPGNVTITDLAGADGHATGTRVEVALSV